MYLILISPCQGDTSIQFKHQELESVRKMYGCRVYDTFWGLGKCLIHFFKGWQVSDNFSIVKVWNVLTLSF